jgi:hypothetical protein
MLRRFCVVVRIALAAVMIPATLGAFAFLPGTPRWPTGSITMHLQLGAGDSLLDGSPNWGAAAEAALAEWNGFLVDRQFRVVRDSTVPIRDGDQVNSVFFSDRAHDRDFGDSTVAVATSWVRGGGSIRVESDVIFNNAFDWNSYRGPLTRTADGDTLYDIRRVAVHEFGHVLGLGHPDEAGQSVPAVMNSRVSNTDRLQNDDIDGIRALYAPASPPPGGSPVVINFPPRDPSMAFRTALEARYRDVLRRGETSSFVDIEGSVVWTQEYLRYRVNRCAHQDAVNRVMMQIDGQGIQPVCGTATSANFPPRNEPFDFRNQLEAKYRDGLNRSGSPTHVDVEGDIVWTQEYLRYRVTRCTHEQATDRVFLQIAGQGIAPGCS